MKSWEDHSQPMPDRRRLDATGESRSLALPLAQPHPTWSRTLHGVRRPPCCARPPGWRTGSRGRALTVAAFSESRVRGLPAQPRGLPWRSSLATPAFAIVVSMVDRAEYCDRLASDLVRTGSLPVRRRPVRTRDRSVGCELSAQCRRMPSKHLKLAGRPDVVDQGNRLERCEMPWTPW